MMASEVGSTNAEPVHIRITNEKAPLIHGRNVFQRLSNLFKIGRTTHSEGDGYVEFGNLGLDGTRTLGTFAGVFSPVTLSMFSALVFIRMGYIVGNAGLLVTLVQFIIAYGILLFTVASVCAISTNGAVEGGGAYFMISRTLGPEFGGSIGTLFFMANVVSSALCISGCAEGLVENFGPSGYLSGTAGLIPDGRWWRFLYCSILNTANLVVCLIGAAMFAKTSVAILAVVCICLGSVFISFLTQGAMEIPIPEANTLVQNATYHVNGSYTGLLSSTLSSNFYSNYSADYSSIGTMTDFASVFGVLFSGVTGIMVMLDSRKDHVKFWRPQMLLMVASPRSACPLIDFVNDLKKGGLYVIGHVNVGEFAGQNSDSTIEEYPHWLSLVDHLRVKAFVELTVTKTVREGMQHLIRLSGMGAMKPNTIVLGFYDEESPRNFFLDSQYATAMFENSTTLPNNVVFPLRQATNEKNLDPIQYVGMCSDVLRMKKNLCLCRNFHLLNKAQLTKNSNLKYIDVWPVNFFQPTDQDPFDTTSLFMLQLACIINMVPSWKNLHLRVFHCETVDGSESLSISDSHNSINEYPRISNEHRIRKSLNLLRISASIKKIPEWGEQIRALKGRSLLEPKNHEYESNTESNSALSNVSRTYILGVNQLIRQNSSQTATTFIYLPAPPISSTWDEDDMYMQYLQSLTELTVDLPPTVLVHGVSAVTSTTL